MQLIFHLILLTFVLTVAKGLINKSDQTSLETNRFKLTKKDRWLQSHLKSHKNRHRRDLVENSKFFKRPCPVNCNCNYETINCNAMIPSCSECFHWSGIDFNQINSMKSGAFSGFKFAPNRTTHVIIYKLVDSTLTRDVFKDMVIPENAKVEIIFQYNSVVTFDQYVLNGVHLKKNSTLIFNFPYTTQVVFVAKCFDGMRMDSANSKVVIRILKSFSVRFVNDFIVQGFMDYKAKLQAFVTNQTDRSEAMSVTNPERHINRVNSSWALKKGQLIVDIKSTHLVKFEDFGLSHIDLKDGARFYMDLDLIEKLIIQKKAFANLNLDPTTRMTIYARHLTFIDFRAYSFSDITLTGNSRMQIYLEELLHSLCLQRNVFDSLTLNENSHFNFSVINSKNVMFMHDAFSNMNLNSPSSKLYMGVYNKPSFQLMLAENNYYREFLKERMEYKWSVNFGNGDQSNYDQYTGLYQPSYPVGSDYFYAGMETEERNLDLARFYERHKLAYAYNMSIERGCFSNLKFGFDQLGNNIWIIADNINTLLLDSAIVTNDQDSVSFKNLNLILSVKHFIPSDNAYAGLNRIRLEFLKSPHVFRLSSEHTDHQSQKTRKIFKIIGLDLNKKSRYYEQDSLDNEIYTSDTHLENACKNTGASSRNAAIVSFEARYSSELEEICSCETIYLLKNQINHNEDRSILNCQIESNTIFLCEQNLKQACEHRSQMVSQPLNETYIQFWKYCISEKEPDHSPTTGLITNGNKINTENYYYNNFNDPDGMFSASMSSSFFEMSESFKSSLSQPDAAIPETLDEPTDASISSNITSIGKIVGMIIIIFMTGIVVFMIVVNFIQYKFRNELLDDLEYTSQNGPGISYNGTRSETLNKELSSLANNEARQEPQGPNFWRKTFSSNSLRRTMSVASLRTKRDKKMALKNNSKNVNVENHLDERSSSSDEDIRYSPNRDNSDSEYAKNAPRLRSQKECDSFFDSDEDSEDSYEYFRETRDEAIEKQHKTVDLKSANGKTKMRTHGEITDSGNPSEIVHSSPVTSDRTIMTPPPGYAAC